MIAITNLPLALAKLPKRLREQLNSCPAKGNGVHSWLFRMALWLHERFAEDEIIKMLKANLSCHRPEREVIDAVENSGKLARGILRSNGLRRWSSVDYEMVHNVVVGCPIRLLDLRTLSPEDLRTKGPMTENILDALFPGNALLCVGRSANVFWTRPREFWRGKEFGFSYGWYPCGRLTENQLMPFMCRAVRLGSDKAPLTRSQFVRNARRRERQSQSTASSFLCATGNSIGGAK